MISHNSSGFDFEAAKEDNIRLRCCEARRKGKEEKEKEEVGIHKIHLTTKLKFVHFREKSKDKKEIKEKFEKAEQGTEFKLRQVLF